MSSSSVASGGFSVAAVEKKLKDLNSTIQSIQGVSQWLIHYRKYAKTVVSTWYKEQHKGMHIHLPGISLEIYETNFMDRQSVSKCMCVYMPVHGTSVNTVVCSTYDSILSVSTLATHPAYMYVLISADSGRKLTLLYVANDVIQNSKKKGPEYRTEFVKVLPRVFQSVIK